MKDSCRVRVIASVVILASAISASSQSSNSSSARRDTARAAARNYFTDMELINQDGKKMRFYTDLLQGKVVIIDAFFTSCTGACPVMNRNMEKIQEWLGDRMGRDVHMISMSVDPITDTPNKLSEYSKRFHARPGWYFITGTKENMDFALQKLGQYVDAREDHTNIFIVGNERTGLWKKAFGLAKPEDLIKVVESVLQDKGAQPPRG